MRMDSLYESRGLFPVASIVVPVVTCVTNLESGVCSLCAGLLSPVVDEPLSLFAHALEEAAVWCVALHDLYDATRASRVGAGYQFECVALREGDVPHLVGYEAFVVVEGVRQ